MKLQEVLFKLESPYAGHPYYVTGNAILSAIRQQAESLDIDLAVAHGMFLPQVYGSYPKHHSQSSGRPSFGASLKPVEAYQDLFLFRRQPNHWIIDGRPRDAYNTHAYHYETRPDQGTRAIKRHRERISRNQYSWYIHTYLHPGDYTTTFPLPGYALDGLYFGKNRNYGYGRTSLVETRVIDLDALDYSSITDNDSFVIELVTPYVLSSQAVNGPPESIPWWWDDELSYRRRTEVIVKNRDRYTLETVDHGQVTRYEGNDPVSTAVNGVTRIGTHKKYGFGEFMIRHTAGR